MNAFQTQFFSEISKIAEHLKTAQELENLVDMLVELRAREGKIFFIGSGGGAGHASHATCDFRKLGGFEAYCPTDNVSELTARINDEGWENSIADCLKSMRLSANDLVFVFSVGGGSEEKNISMNLVKAMQYAKDIGAKVTGVVGRDGGVTAKMSETCIIIPEINKQLVTPLTESYQAIVWHYLVSHPKIQCQAAKWEATK